MLFRSRECRPYLLSLGLRQEPAGGAPTLELEAAIDPQGRSLRPEQIAHWLGPILGQPLVAEGLCRRQLCLRSC